MRITFTITLLFSLLLALVAGAPALGSRNDELPAPPAAAPAAGKEGHSNGPAASPSSAGPARTQAAESSPSSSRASSTTQLAKATSIPKARPTASGNMAAVGAVGNNADSAPTTSSGAAAATASKARGAAALQSAVASMPIGVTWSSSVLLEQLVADVPFVALGLLGIGIGTVYVSLGRLNRPIFVILLSTTLEFVGSIGDMGNLLSYAQANNAAADPAAGTAQAPGNTTTAASSTTVTSTTSFGRNTGLAIATQIVFGLAVATRLAYLHRRSMVPHVNETPVPLNPSPPLATVAGGGELGGPRGGWAKRFSFRPKAGREYVHSGSYSRFGVLGGLWKVTMLLMVWAVGILEVIWRLGFESNVNKFKPVFFASAGLQIGFFTCLSIKTIESTYHVSARPRSRNFRESGPILFGNAIGVGVGITNFLILAFSETPLGRFFITVQVYTYLIDLIFSDERRPIRDSFSFDRAATPYDRKVMFADELPNGGRRSQDAIDEKSSVGAGEEDASEVQNPTSMVSVRSGPTIRRSSRMPSWLPAPSGAAAAAYTEGGEEAAGLSGNAAPHARNGSGASETRVEIGVAQGGIGSLRGRGVTIPARGRGPQMSTDVPASMANPASSFYSSVYTTSSIEAPMPPLPAAREHKKSGSTAVYAGNGIRLSSPTIDHKFVFPGEQSREALPGPGKRGFQGNEQEQLDTPPAAPTRPLQVPPKRPAQPQAMTSFESGGSSGEGKRTTDSSGRSRNSEGPNSVHSISPSAASQFSLSNFPEPPTTAGLVASGVPANATAEGRYGSSIAGRMQMGDSLYVDGSTFTFDLPPPGRPSDVISSYLRPESGESMGSERRPRDITSFINDLSVPSDATPSHSRNPSGVSGLRREVQLSPVSESTATPPGSPFSVSGAEIVEAKVVERTPSQAKREEAARAGTRAAGVRNDSFTRRGAVGLPATPKASLSRNGSTGSTSSKASSTATATLTTTSMAATAASSQTSQTSPGTYDPARPFERPRPAPPMEVIREGGWAPQIQVAVQKPSLPMLRRGGNGSKGSLRGPDGKPNGIVVMRQEEF